GGAGSLVFSPDGRRLAGTGMGVITGVLGLWDVDSGKLLKTLDIPGTFGMGWEVLGLRFTADGKKLTGRSSVMGAYAWDVGSGKCDATPGNVEDIGTRPIV